MTSANNKYIIFKVKELYCAVNCLDVQEIIRETDKVTTIPGSENYIDGVLNLRGSIVTIINLALYFKLDCVPEENESIIILNDDDERIGVKVTQIIDVVNGTNVKLENTPAIPHNLNPLFVESVMQIDNEIVTVLDVTEILSE